MLSAIDTKPKFDDLELVKHLKDLKSPFFVTISKVYEEVNDLLDNRIQAIFPKYTLHNTQHSFRIIECMNKVIGDPTKLDQLEITLLICSALLHDIGMAVSEEDIIAIKKDAFPFCEVKFSTMLKMMNNNEELALQEYIRRIHSSLSGKFIRERLKDKLTIPNLLNLDYTNELANICTSHTEDYDWIKSKLKAYEVRGDYHFNSQFIACVLRLADILDIDGNRTPYRLYQSIAPQDRSDEEWKQHFVIQNNDKIVINDVTREKKIIFHGICRNASIHRKILSYTDWVKNELTNLTALTKGMLPQYNLLFDTNPEVNIQTEGYTFSDYKMTLQFKAISSLLMGEKIYGNRSLGLRELIQNSIDACKIRQEQEKATYEYGKDIYQPKIKVILDPEKNQVVIKDNGIGMSMDIIKRHFLNIGVSYYKSEDFLLKDLSYKPIGNYGIGFLSCFMLSNKVIVKSRNYKSPTKYSIELERGNEWTSLTEVEDLNFFGTEVVLNYIDFIKVFGNNAKRVEEFLSEYFLTDEVDFELINKQEKTTEKIKNPIIDSEKLVKGMFRIDFSEYLNEIEGYAIIKKKKSFIRSIEDIRFNGNLYRYDRELGLANIEDDSKIDLDDYISEEEFNILEIPLVDSHMVADFNKGLQFLYNIDEVIEKLESDLKWISILIPKDQLEYLEEGEIDRDTEILEKLNGQTLVDLGHSNSCKTKSSLRTVKLFEGSKNTLYLPFDKVPDYGFNLIFAREMLFKKLFIRNVLIKDFHFNLPVLASVFDISRIIINIKSRDFIPDISRNNIDDESKPTLNYIIGKAIHKAAMEILDLKPDEKLTLGNFISTYYNESTIFEKHN